MASSIGARFPDLGPNWKQFKGRAKEKWGRLTDDDLDVINGRQDRWSSGAARPEPQGSYNAQRNYERYLALAQAEAQSGNLIAAENYYQHAEHYFRMMSSDRGAT